MHKLSMMNRGDLLFSPLEKGRAKGRCLPMIAAVNTSRNSQPHLPPSVGRSNTPTLPGMA